MVIFNNIIYYNIIYNIKYIFNIKVFRLSETRQLKDIVDTTLSVTEVVEEEEIRQINIKQFDAIKEKIHIPKHNHKTKTITLVKLFTPDFDFSAFLKTLLDCLIPEVEIRIGLSFIMSRKGDLSYVYAIPSRNINEKHRIVQDRGDKRDLVAFFKALSYTELLHLSFNMRNSTNPFAESGYNPVKIVTATFWITKWKTP